MAYMIFLCSNLITHGAACHPHPNQARFETPEQCETALWRDESIEVLISNWSTAQFGVSIQAICVPVS
jgi:hypothetical protein